MCDLIISPQLFNILLKLYAPHGTNIVVNIQEQVVNNLRFAEDIALIANSEEDLPTLVNLVHQSSSAFGLKINITKTEVQAISNKDTHLNITIDNNNLLQMEEFTYM
ncbi:uncharacterized protein [Amphiura filiformis]|uniref:uncharacterized protein n=1 Tax=Amphiura filiformis TaxID=82378 RepID=UPI003B220AA5